MINKYLLEYQRVDLLFDRYFVNRINMLLGTVSVMADDTISSRTHQSPEIGKNVMKNSKNKAELFRFVAEFVRTLISPD